jgi:rubrerythrin
MRSTTIKESIEVALRGDHLSSVPVIDADNVSAMIRLAINAENEAIILYQKIASATDNELVKQVMLDVADEEKVHAGEFLRLLKEIDPDESDFYAEGADEVEDEIDSD